MNCSGGRNCKAEVEHLQNSRIFVSSGEECTHKQDRNMLVIVGAFPSFHPSQKYVSILDKLQIQRRSGNGTGHNAARV